LLIQRVTKSAHSRNAIDSNEVPVKLKSLIVAIAGGIALRGIAPPIRGLSSNGNESVM
jgi:hypothetical protein